MTQISTTDYICILPELVLTAFGIVVMLVDPLLGPKVSRKGLGVFSLLGTLAAIAAAYYQTSISGSSGWFEMVRVDSFSIFFHILIPAISAVCILASLEYLDQQNIRSGEYYALILFGTVGMALMSA
ncbi:MAG TPA: NADH-quinone oxidoreductase subunit N, partial [Verrucomicrobiae bacterium]|nr:NADH-quinone oxidoreductase subunit N [Verrucomicrobiae bacterium]